jgi:hypothetical protein
MKGQVIAELGRASEAAGEFQQGIMGFGGGATSQGGVVEPGLDGIEAQERAVGIPKLGEAVREHEHAGALGEMDDGFGNSAWRLMPRGGPSAAISTTRSSG